MGISYNPYDMTYNISAAGDIILATVTNSGEVAANWIDEILRIHWSRLNHLIVGLDIEWCPHGFHGTTGENPAALLQLCVGRRCLVFQLMHCDFIPDELHHFLKDGCLDLVGVGIEGDAEKLLKDYNLQVGPTTDLRHLAASKMERGEMQHWGLQKLVGEILGVEMEKPRHVRVSNWAVPSMSLQQIQYAALDAFLSFEVGRRLYAGHY